MDEEIRPVCNHCGVEQTTGLAFCQNCGWWLNDIVVHHEDRRKAARDPICLRCHCPVPDGETCCPICGSKIVVIKQNDSANDDSKQQPLCKNRTCTARS